MFSCLSNKVCDEKVEEQVTNKKAEYTDELTMKRSPSTPSKVVKKSVRFADSEPSGEENYKEKLGRCIIGGDGLLGERGGIRVKLKMTKEEATRLLSKCKEGGVLEFKDVATQLVALPLNRVTVVSSCTNQ
ncbi:hypothetical protein RJT34_05280 [Clitoria ternatea]|uniref:DUF7890 domain-containing protein n=1 Tax=Clitoria ternatea TaxID=43366 RepID=A0AAN9K4A7_CLITE